MAVLKCKMCGGTLEVTEGMKVVECDYCGTTQTIPNDDNEKKLNLFNRANRMRMLSEFDKAASIYENIIAEFPDEAEAYWGLCLCKYGIEYVDDPKTATKIPTCHRTLFASIFNDADYKAALERSDVIAQDVYKKEATEIDRLQKEILELVAKEEPYDVFICYKETDDSGKRTPDSVLGQDIYDALTNKGHKVFFARITLEDKLGRAYEPCIFAALNSAKIMLSLGTKPEYFEAVWVKNEWSRFLEMMKADRSKMLIPCYRDMDAYDLPMEFSHLQAQDMGKLGFLQDLIRGIEKILGVEQQPAQQAPAAAAAAVNSAVEPLLKRANLFLEDKDYNSANEYFEKVLDQDPECAEAYLGKMMVEFHVNQPDMLMNQDNPFQKNSNYQKAVRFADAALREKLTELISGWQEHTYEKACDMLETGISEQCTNAIKIFREIIDYKDAQKKIEACKDIINGNTYKRALSYLQKAKSKYSVGNVVQAIRIFEQIRDYADAAEQIRQCKRLRQEAIEKGYKRSSLVKSILSAGHAHTVGVKTDGTVVPAGNIYSTKCKVFKWTDIIAVAAGFSHTVGLKSDGRVIAVGDYVYIRKVSRWTDMVAIASGGNHIVGLKADGTVVAVGDNQFGQCEVSGWTNIVAIAAGARHTVGLKSNGTVVATKILDPNTRRLDNGQCNVSGWTDIVAISANYHTVGLKSDGTVVAVGSNSYGECNVSNWTDMIAITAGYNYTVGVKVDGTVVAVGEKSSGKCNISNWTDIIAVAAGQYHTVGVKANGTVVAVGDKSDNQCDVSGWRLFRNIDSFEQERKENMEKMPSNFLQQMKERLRL